MVANEELDPVEKAARSPDVYVFYKDTTGLVDAADPGDLKNAGYRFLADMEGWSWTGMAIVEVRNLYGLPSVADRVLGGPEDPVDDTAKPVQFGARVLRRTIHFPYFGFARLQVREGMAREVLRAIDDRADGYSGSALVSGTFNILVDLGADTPDQVQQHLAALADFDGVVGHASGQVAGDQYYYKGERRRLGETG